jgi:hypothetical protein
MAAMPDADITQSDPDQYPGDQTGHMNPALQGWADQFQTKAGSAYANDAADMVQNYLTSKAVATQNEVADQAFTQNMLSTRNGLVNMVKSDPGSTNLALDLAPLSINALLDQHGHMPDDQKQSVSDDLTGHFRTEIAHAGVVSIANLDHDAAMQALDQYKGLIPPDQQNTLRAYAAQQQFYRQADNAVAAQQQQKDLALHGYQNASDHLGSMIDENGNFRAPQGFLQTLSQDTRLSPMTKQALHVGYQNLNMYGDPAQSDPHVVANLVSRMAGVWQPPTLADLQRPGRDAINEGAGPIGETLIAAATGGAAGAIRAGGTALAAGAAEGAVVGAPAATGARAAAMGVGALENEGSTAIPFGARFMDATAGQAALRNTTRYVTAPATFAATMLGGDNGLGPVALAASRRQGPPQQSEVMSHLGTGLRASHAQFLNGLMAPASTQRAADIRQLAYMVNDARAQYGEHGVAGDESFSRYVNWLLPTLMGGTSLGEIADMGAVQRFAPTWQDYATTVLRGRGGLAGLSIGSSGGLRVVSPSGSSEETVPVRSR